MAHLRRNLPLTFTFIIGFLASFILFKIVINWEHENQRIEFEALSMNYAHTVEHTLYDYLEGLNYVGDFFKNSELVTRKEFTEFVMSAIARHPGIQAMGWNPLILNSERTYYESLARENGFENFMFTERTEEKELVRAAQRDEYVIVYFIEPLEVNKAALGYDIASNPVRLKAIHQAFDTGNLSATERITLVQGKGDQFGILILLPIYKSNAPLKTVEDRRKHRKGFIVEVLRIGDAVEKALKDYPDEEVEMYLYDLSAEDENRLLYFRPSRISGMSKHRLEEKEIQKGLYWSKNFNLADRQWQMLFRPSSVYMNSHQSWQAWIVLSASLLLTSLLAFYLSRKSIYTAEIEQKVQEQMQTNLKMEKEIIERKKAEESLTESEVKFRSVVESSPMGMHMYQLESDNRLVFTGYNHAADQILGLDNSQFMGKTVEDAFPSLIDTEIPDHYRQTAAEGKPWMTDQITYEDEKISGAFQVHAFRTESNKVVAMFLDITEKKKAEKEQQRLTAELVVKNKELEQVLYITSHDLRSPLVNINGYSAELDYSLKELISSIENLDDPSIIKEKIAPLIKADIPKSLHYIQISVSKMEALLKGILTLSRLGSSPLKREEIDMNEMMIDVIDNHRFRLNELRIKTDVSTLPDCKGDSSQINQVFSNLLDNAMKYSDTERSSFIKISGYKNTHQSVYCMEDNGIGIAPEHKDKIFEIFYQLDPKRVQGEGMGLTIAHKIIAKHNGKIWVESEMGKGSKFFVSIPRI